MLHIIAVRTPEQTETHANLLEPYLERADIFTPSNQSQTLGDLFEREMAYSQLRASNKSASQLLETGEFILGGEISPYYLQIYELARRHKKPEILLIKPLTKTQTEQTADFYHEAEIHIRQARAAFLTEQPEQKIRELTTNAVHFLSCARYVQSSRLLEKINTLCASYSIPNPITTWLVALNDLHDKTFIESIKRATSRHAPRTAFELIDISPQPYTINNYAAEKHFSNLPKGTTEEKLTAQYPYLEIQLATDIILETIFAPEAHTLETIFAHAHKIATLDKGEKQILTNIARQNAQEILSPYGFHTADQIAKTCGIRAKNPARILEKHYPFNWDENYSTKSL